jgi:hypothetical protein
MSTFETSIYVFNETLDAEILTPVRVEYDYEPEWISTDCDPGEPELFEITRIVDKNTGKELTEDDIDTKMICEEIEKEIRDFFEDEKDFVEMYDDYEY